MSSMVFIHPTHLAFPDNYETQTISIFNPYDFTIHFHFECTRPSAFVLSSTNGTILAKHSLDISASLLDKTIVEEKFQVRIKDSSGKRMGEKIIKVTLKSNDKQAQDEDTLRQRKPPKVDHFQELAQTSGFDKSISETTEYSAKKLKMDKVPNEYFLYAALLVCIVILFLPHEESGGGHSSHSANTNRMLEVSVNLKLVAAYVIGILTVFLIRN